MIHRSLSKRHFSDRSEDLYRFLKPRDYSALVLLAFLPA
jgi:hypothetical protein